MGDNPFVNPSTMTFSRDYCPHKYLLSNIKFSIKFVYFSKSQWLLPKAQSFKKINYFFLLLYQEHLCVCRTSLIDFVLGFNGSSFRLASSIGWERERERRDALYQVWDFLHLLFLRGKNPTPWISDSW